MYEANLPLITAYLLFKDTTTYVDILLVRNTSKLD